MERVKVSSSLQIAVPAAARKQLDIKAGDYLNVHVRDGEIVLTPERDDPVERLWGLHKEVWQGIDVDAYLEEERNSWDASPTPS